MTLEQAFQRQALTNAQAAMTLHGAPTKRLVQTLELRGGVETARELIGKRRLSDGFDVLRRCGRLDLSLEALVIQGKFGALFTDEESNLCLEVLMEAGFF